jgi:ubiquinol-cytochrome c reductase cytochrome b subunit
LHYLMPFLIAGLTIVHLSLLHKTGSNNPLGINKNIEVVSFYTYFYVKDLLAFFFIISYVFFFCFLLSKCIRSF